MAAGTGCHKSHRPGRCHGKSHIFPLIYIYGAPFLYGTLLIPVAAPTALAFACIWDGLVIAAGPSAFPARYFVGPSTIVRFLRTFHPLMLAILLLESILKDIVPVFSRIRYALEMAITLVAFTLITGYVVTRVSRGWERPSRPRRGNEL